MPTSAFYVLLCSNTRSVHTGQAERSAPCAEVWPPWPIGGQCSTWSVFSMHGLVQLCYTDTNARSVVLSQERSVHHSLTDTHRAEQLRFYEANYLSRWEGGAATEASVSVDTMSRSGRGCDKHTGLHRQDVIRRVKKRLCPSVMHRPDDESLRVHICSTAAMTVLLEED